MKEKLKRFASFIFRVDVLNRIIVFISIAFFVVLPSIILYHLDDTNFSLRDSVPSLMVLGVVLGTGLLTFYRPIRTTWFYFLQVALVLSLYYGYFAEVSVDGISDIFYTGNIIAVEITYCVIGFLLNIVFFFISFNRYRKSKIAFDEHTNADTFFDFVNGGETNKQIEKEVNDIIPNTLEGRAVQKLKNTKFSRILRIGSLFFYLFAVFDALFSIGFSSTYMIFVPAAVSLLSLPILVLVSILYPRDFKYMYYYNAIFLNFMLILCSTSANITPFFMIISLVILVVSLLVTLITEGRTWTGATPDQK